MLPRVASNHILALFSEKIDQYKKKNNAKNETLLIAQFPNIALMVPNGHVKSYFVQFLDRKLTKS